MGQQQVRNPVNPGRYYHGKMVVNRQIIAEYRHPHPQRNGRKRERETVGHVTAVHLHIAPADGTVRLIRSGPPKQAQRKKACG